MIRKRLFQWLGALAASRRGWLVLLAAGLMSAVSLALVPQLPIHTTRDGLVSDQLPVQKRYIEYNRDFGTPNQLIVLLEGDPQVMRRATDAVAAALEKDDEWVKNVFYRIDYSALRKAGLYYLSQGDLTQLRDTLDEQSDLLTRMFAQGTWAAVLETIQEKTGSMSLDDIKDKKKTDDAFAAVDHLLSQWQRFVENPEQATVDLGARSFGELASAREQQVDSEGFLVGKDGRTFVLFVQQSRPIDNTEFILPFMTHCRTTVADTLKDFPGVTAGFTGWPVSIEEEMGFIEIDLRNITLISGILILVLYLLAFRSIHRTILVFIPLIFGVLWNLAATLYTVGHLDYLSSISVGVLFGLGVDYGVVFVRRFDEERAAGRSPAEAVSVMLTSVGPGVLTGAATTIAAFMALGSTDQPAFSDMGIISGTGVLFVLFSTMFLLPVLLCKFPPKVDPATAKQRSESKVLRKTATVLSRHPVTITVVGLALIVFLLAQIPKVGFDYNLNNLLPVDSEMLTVAEKLEANTDYKLQYVSLVSDSLDQVWALQPMLEGLPTVQRVESLSMLVPPDQAKKRALFPGIAQRIEAIPIGAAATPVDMDQVRTRLASLAQKIETAQEDAFSDGRTDLVGHLDKTLARLEQIGQALGKPSATEAQTKFEQAFFSAVADAKTEFLAMTAQPPITLSTLPEDLRARFVSQSGKLATYIFPKGEIWDMAFLDEFLGQIQGAAGQVFGEDQAPNRMTGWGVVFRVTSRMIREGFTQASLMAALIVFGMLWLDFRNLKHVMLAITPLVVAIAAGIGGLGLIGRDLNLASQISFPILLGIGVDYGVLMTRRWLEKDGQDLIGVVAGIGSAISLAGLTTIAGFGALLFARHRGMISFGEVLVIAVACGLVASLFGLPAIIKTFKLDKRDK